MKARFQIVERRIFLPTRAEPNLFGNRLFLHIVYKEVDITFAAEQKTVANGK